MKEEHRQYYLAWLNSDKQIPQYVIDNFKLETELIKQRKNGKR